MSNTAPVYDYNRDATILKDFINQYNLTLEDSDSEADLLADPIEVYKYKELLQDVADRKKSTLPIELSDLIEWNTTGAALAEKIEQNTLRYLDICYETIDSILPPPSYIQGRKPDVVDVLLQQRQQRLQDIQNDETENVAQQANQANETATPVVKQTADTVQLPKSLQRRFEIVFIAPRTTIPQQLRNVKANCIGKLVKLQGIVTRMSEVKPLLTIATYTCQECGHENYQEVKSREFMPLSQCGSRSCSQRKTKGTLELQTRGSKFIKFQEIKLQELPDQVPIGHTPRSMTVHAMGELTRLCSAGDVATVTGVFLPTPYSGWQALRAGLIADTYLQAMHIEKQIKSYASYHITDKMLTEITKISRERGIYERLASSIAPEIFGHEDVKKALLLLMVGASTREMPDGMKIRGDINICLMGDPGVAKSQLLRHLSGITPRGVYTSGKGASGVGLTAAVVRDPITREFVLEGGSLVLADMGICCIDEFDKMDESDRTAIHEVMEQQTISIAKAGINTTLNARTSILAAANPAYGRYNPKRSPSENINLPAALLSRFDLLFLILDKPDYEHDLALATHVTHVHMHGKHPESDHLSSKPLSTETMRAYIAQARKFNPHIPQELTQYIVSAYVKIRQMEAASPDQHAYTTARTLLSILRLSQALARLSMREVVIQSDVDEAIRLLDVSQSTLEEDRNKNTNTSDPISAIYEIIRNLAVQEEEIQISLADIIPRVVAKGFTQQQLKQCLDEYENFQVWTVSADQTYLTFV